MLKAGVTFNGIASCKNDFRVLAQNWCWVLYETIETLSLLGLGLVAIKSLLTASSHCKLTVNYKIKL